MNSNICIFGEVLFDNFPDGSRVLGGAPFNVSWHLQAFGQAPAFISAIGHDESGQKIQQAMLNWGIGTDAVTINEQQSSGQVNVQLVNNEPEYDIVSPSAWDEITVNRTKIPTCKLLYHGSLALRHPHNRESLQQLIGDPAQKVFLDVNLRTPWWTGEQVIQMVKECDWVKLNIDELNLLYPSSSAIPARLQSLIDDNALKGIILTQGSKGASITTGGGECHEISPQHNARVVDTVGAGDAFCSIILLGLSLDWPLDTTLQRAQAFASAIVEKRGATVDDPSFYQPFKDQWSL
jgi:fructokinase